MKFMYILLCFGVLSSCSTNYEASFPKLPRLKTVGDDFSCEEKIKIYEYEINSYNKYADDIERLYSI